MTFETVVDDAGGRRCFVDGCEVPAIVFDTLRPSLLFPVRTGLTEAEALAHLAAVKAAYTPEPHRGPYFHTAIAGAKPLRSDALAVHPKQIAQAVARNKRHGLEGLRYDRRGRPVFTDAGQRKKLMKIEKVRQQNSYYGA